MMGWVWIGMWAGFGVLDEGPRGELIGEAESAVGFVTCAGRKTCTLENGTGSRGLLDIDLDITEVGDAVTHMNLYFPHLTR